MSVCQLASYAPVSARAHFICFALTSFASLEDLRIDVVNQVCQLQSSVVKVSDSLVNGSFGANEWRQWMLHWRQWRFGKWRDYGDPLVPMATMARMVQNLIMAAALATMAPMTSMATIVQNLIMAAALATIVPMAIVISISLLAPLTESAPLYQMNRHCRQWCHWINWRHWIA